MRYCPESVAGACKSEKAQNASLVGAPDNEQLIVLFGGEPGVLEACKRWAQDQSYEISFGNIQARRLKLDSAASRRLSIIVVCADFDEPNTVLECRTQLLSDGLVRIIWMLSNETCRNTSQANVAALCKRVNNEHNSICACVTEEEFLTNAGTILDSINAGIVPINETVYRAVFSQSHAGELRGKAGSHEIVDVLTDREVEVLRLAAKGLKQREIAQVLERSVHTVSGYFKSAYAKLEVSTRTEAIFEAKELGYL